MSNTGRRRVFKCSITAVVKQVVLFAFLFLLPILSNAQLHFPTLLTNELDTTPIDDSTRNVIVLIHGWNPGGDANAYLQGQEWSNLVAQLKVTGLAGAGWKVVEYHRSKHQQPRTLLSRRAVGAGESDLYFSGVR